MVDELYRTDGEGTMCHIPACHRPNHPRVGSLEEDDSGQGIRLCHVGEVWLGEVVKHRMRDGPSGQEKGCSGDADIEVDRKGLVLKGTEHLSCSSRSQFRSNKNFRPV